MELQKIRFKYTLSTVNIDTYLKIEKQINKN